MSQQLTSPGDPAPQTATSTPVVKEACVAAVADQRDLPENRGQAGEHPESGTPHEAEEPGEAHREAGEYEDMDVSSGSHAQDQDTLATERHSGQTHCAHQAAAVTAEKEATEERLSPKRQEGECDAEHLCANQQARLVEKLNGMTGTGTLLARVARTAQEYEEMDGFPERSRGCEQPEYQNLPGKGLDVAQEMGSSMCASFDNPDYWHSRLFLKPDAIRT